MLGELSVSRVTTEQAGYQCTHVAQWRALDLMCRCMSASLSFGDFLDDLQQLHHHVVVVWMNDFDRNWFSLIESGTRSHSIVHKGLDHQRPTLGIHWMAEQGSGSPTASYCSHCTPMDSPKFRLRIDHFKIAQSNDGAKNLGNVAIISSGVVAGHLGTEILRESPEALVSQRDRGVPIWKRPLQSRLAGVVFCRQRKHRKEERLGAESQGKHD